MARVLVVDDNELIGRTFKRVLGMKHNVTAVIRGPDAVGRIAAGERFDAVICDVDMPGMTGLEVLAAVSTIDPDQARRFVFVTAKPGMQTSEGRMLGQQNPCLTKPFNTDELLAIISGFLPISLLPRSGVRRAVQLDDDSSAGARAAKR